MGFEAALADNVAALKVIFPIDHNDHAAEVQIPQGGVRIVRSARQAQPENIDGGSMLNPLEVRGVGRGGMTAVTPDRERRLNLDGAGGTFGSGAKNVAGLWIRDQTGDLVFHEDASIRIFAHFGGQEVEQIPLRHQGDEVGGRWKLSKVSDEVAAVAK